MSTLVVGPSCSGKSTWIHHNGADSDVVYASELDDRDVRDAAVIHYNMLFLAGVMSQQGVGNLPSEWDFTEEPMFAKILAGRVDKAVVLVAPVAELEQRMAQRSLIEPTRLDPGQYRGDLWLGILNSVDLFACYERLFDALDRAGVPVEVLYASARSSDGEVFLASDRVDVHHNLRGVHHPPRTEHEVQEVLDHPGAEYQSVLLPRGTRTSSRGFDHLPDQRDGAFSVIRDRSFVNRSVLDIGCALGDMLLRLERYGAGRLHGIDLKAPRFDAAMQIAKLLRSEIVLEQGDFLDRGPAEQFDDVLLLNVLHHVSDFRTFLMKAADRAGERLIVEYPTLRDPKFQELGRFDDELAHLPVVGVSSSRADQTFVFTRAALERIIAEVGDFTVRWEPSAIEHREIGVFSRA